jgi:hypothetical protein
MWSVQADWQQIYPNSGRVLGAFFGPAMLQYGFNGSA